MTTESNSRLGYMDTFRFVAAGLVVFQHIAELHTGSRFVNTIVGFGPGVAGVVLFFLVSGFVIPFSVQRGFDPLDFLIRRVFRIYPLFLIGVVIVSCAGFSDVLANWRFLVTASPKIWLANLLLVQDFVGAHPILGVSWTLIIELIWYGLFAGALLFCGNNAGRVLAMAVPAGLLALALLSVILSTRIPLGRPAMIYAAVLGYQIYLYRSGCLRRLELVFHIAAFFVVTWITNGVAFGLFSHPHLTLAQVVGPWTFSTLLFLLFTLWTPLRSASVVNTGVLPKLGATSYSVYLFHPIAIAASSQYAPQAWNVPISLMLTAALSWLGYNLIERSGISLGRAIVRARHGLPNPNVPNAGESRIA